MAGHSGPKRPSRRTAAPFIDFDAINRELDAEEAARNAFVGPPAPPAPPKRYSLGWHLQQLIDPNSELRRKFDPPPPRLSTELAQQLARRRWLANDVAKAAALEHVKAMSLLSRAAAAREIVGFLTRRSGKTVTVETAEAWLKAAGWTRPTQEG